MTEKEYNNLKVGDVITYRWDGEEFHSRIVALTVPQYATEPGRLMQGVTLVDLDDIMMEEIHPQCPMYYWEYKVDLVDNTNDGIYTVENPIPHCENYHIDGTALE